jgi:hypothetical protein
MQGGSTLRKGVAPFASSVIYIGVLMMSMCGVLKPFGLDTASFHRTKFSVVSQWTTLLEIQARGIK